LEPTSESERSSGDTIPPFRLRSEKDIRPCIDRLGLRGLPPLPAAATFVFFLLLFFLPEEAAAAAAAECELKHPNSDFHDDLAIVARRVSVRGPSACDLR
jgi:hypothetical protein